MNALRSYCVLFTILFVVFFRSIDGNRRGVVLRVGTVCASFVNTAPRAGTTGVCTHLHFNATLVVLGVH